MQVGSQELNDGRENFRMGQQGNEDIVNGDAIAKSIIETVFGGRSIYPPIARHQSIGHLDNVIDRLAIKHVPKNHVALIIELVDLVLKERMPIQLHRLVRCLNHPYFSICGSDTLSREYQ